MPKKWLFSNYFCIFEIVTSKQNFFASPKFLFFNGFDLKKCVFRLIIFRRPENLFFRIFLVILKSSHEDETFSFLQKISYFLRFRFKKKRVFRLNIFLRPKKWLFSNYFCIFKIVTSRQNFFAFAEISYLQRFWFF